MGGGMNRKFNQATEAARLIRRIAGAAQQRLKNNHQAFRISRRIRRRPIDYMRWAEFDAVLRMLDLKPGQTVLDVASPQWLTLYLAASNPNVHFNFISIMESEVEPYRAIAAAHGLNNLEYAIEDVRKLSWPPSSFDKVLSVSVLEHVYPEVGGDVIAFEEIRRVLKDDGELLLTMPCKHIRRTLYMDGPVYEREESGRNFFAREYDMDSFHDLVSQTGFRVDEEWRIEERPGLLAIDDLEWGEGRTKGLWPWLVKKRARFERLIGISFDEVLAKRYLKVGKQPVARLVNVAARLKPGMSPAR